MISKSVFIITMVFCLMVLSACSSNSIQEIKLTSKETDITSKNENIFVGDNS